MKLNIHIKIGLLAAVLLCSGCFSEAYSQQKKTVVVKSDSNTAYEQILPPEMVYAYAGDFPSGRLYYKDGKVGDYNLNYHLVTQKAIFKSKNGQILEFAYPEHIKGFMIGEEFWTPVGEGFGLIVYHSDAGIDLIRYSHTECTDVRKEGAFGAASPTAAISNVSSLQTSDGTHRMLTKGEYDFEVKVDYYLSVNGSVFPADAKGFKRAFPSKKKEISEYLKDKRLNLSKEEDIVNLVKFSEAK